MKRLKLLALACVASLCCAAVLAGCSSQSYTPPEKSQTVPASALSTQKTLRVGVNAQAAPLAGQTASSSEIVGIDVDIAAAIADELGVKLEVVDVGRAAESALNEGRVDIVMGIDSSTSDSSYWRSDPYLTTGVALFAPSSSTSIPATDSKPTIAAQTSSKSSWRVTNLFGDSSLLSQSDLKSAFAAMSSNMAQYVAADAVIGTYIMHSNNYDAKIIALLQDPSGYCVGVSSKNTELQNAITAALTKIVSGGVVDIVETKWLGAPVNTTNITVVKSATAAAASSSSSSASSASSSDNG